MSKTKNGVKPVKGKTLPLSVDPKWSSEQLLAAAKKKMKDFNQDMEDGEYVLFYPDGTHIKNIPGTDTPFTTELYKEAIGKAYQRITLYICTFDALLSKSKYCMINKVSICPCVYVKTTVWILSACEDSMALEIA